jgi:hypothetical protein
MNTLTLARASRAQPCMCADICRGLDTPRLYVAIPRATRQPSRAGWGTRVGCCPSAAYCSPKLTQSCDSAKCRSCCVIDVAACSALLAAPLAKRDGLAACSSCMSATAIGRCSWHSSLSAQPADAYCARAEPRKAPLPPQQGLPTGFELPSCRTRFTLLQAVQIWQLQALPGGSNSQQP